MPSHSEQGTNMHHTYDYADPDVCLQHTNIALQQLGNGEKGPPFLTSKQGKSTIPKHFQATTLQYYTYII